MIVFILAEIGATVVVAVKMVVNNIYIAKVCHFNTVVDFVVVSGVVDVLDVEVVIVIKWLLALSWLLDLQ